MLTQTHTHTNVNASTRTQPSTKCTVHTTMPGLRVQFFIIGIVVVAFAFAFVAVDSAVSVCPIQSASVCVPLSHSLLLFNWLFFSIRRSYRSPFSSLSSSSSSSFSHFVLYYHHWLFQISLARSRSRCLCCCRHTAVHSSLALSLSLDMCVLYIEPAHNQKLSDIFGVLGSLSRCFTCITLWIECFMGLVW